ncbi:S26 family signal peptidase [Kitasatospora camelliae]|uniref:S26 family signal peptidase n=1 Tax=Kitasatospora camelliae TaxID=3156397 RepID=A0AAU8KAZ1_9ACTN
MTGTTSAALAGATAVALAAAATLTARLLRRRLFLVTVRGLSMFPTLAPGDRMLAVGPGRRPPRTGDIVVAPAPRTVGWAGQRAARTDDRDAHRVIKRVAAVGGDRVPERLRSFSGLRDRESVPEGTVLLLGDGRHSEDSRHWGFCPQHLLVGRVLLRVARGPAAAPGGHTGGQPPAPGPPVPIPAPDGTRTDGR